MRFRVSIQGGVTYFYLAFLSLLCALWIFGGGMLSITRINAVLRKRGIVETWE